MEMSVKTPINGRYVKDGFFVFPEPILDRDLVSRAKEGMDKVRGGEYDTGKPPALSFQNPSETNPHALCKIMQPQFANRAIRELISFPAIGERVAAVTGAEMVQVWWVQLLYKPPMVEDGDPPTKVGWHRDWAYFKPSWEGPTSDIFTAWVALSNINDNSGPMRFVPGSHKWDELEGGDFDSQDSCAEDFTLGPDQVWKEQSALMRSGGMSIHNVLTLHGSDQNFSKEPRRSLAIHLRTEKSRPANGKREGLAKFIDDLKVCPIIFGEKVAQAFV